MVELRPKVLQVLLPCEGKTWGKLGKKGHTYGDKIEKMGEM